MPVFCSKNDENKDMNDIDSNVTDINVCIISAKGEMQGRHLNWNCQEFCLQVQQEWPGMLLLLALQIARLALGMHSKSPWIFAAGCSLML